MEMACSKQAFGSWLNDKKRSESWKWPGLHDEDVL